MCSLCSPDHWARLSSPRFLSKLPDRFRPQVVHGTAAPLSLSFASLSLTHERRSLALLLPALLPRRRARACGHEPACPAPSPLASPMHTTRRARPSHAVAAMAVVAASRTRCVPLRPAHPAFQRRAMAAAATGRARRRRWLTPPPVIVAAERSSPWSPYLRPPSSPNDHPAAFPTSQGSSSTKPRPPLLAGAPPPRPSAAAGRLLAWRRHHEPPQRRPSPSTGSPGPPLAFPQRPTRRRRSPAPENGPPPPPLSPTPAKGHFVISFKFPGACLQSSFSFLVLKAVNF